MCKRLMQIVILVVVGVGCATEPDGSVVTDDFSSNTLSDYDRYGLGGNPNVWTTESGWLVGRADGDATNAILVRRGVSLADGHVEFTTDHITAGGLVFRMQDDGNFYLLAVRDDAASYYNMTVRNFELYAWEAGNYRTLLRRDLDLPRGSRAAVAVQFEGEQIALFLNGDLVEVVEDGTFTEAGAVGLTHDDRLTPGEESRYDSWAWGPLP